MSEITIMSKKEEKEKKKEEKINKINKFVKSDGFKKGLQLAALVLAYKLGKYVMFKKWSKANYDLLQYMIKNTTYVEYSAANVVDAAKK